MSGTTTESKKQCLFVCNALGNSKTDVTRFIGTDSISLPYRFDITLTSADVNIDADKLLKKPATLFIPRNDEMYPYSGIITSFKYLSTSTDYSTYHIVLQPSLWLLSMTMQSRIFQKLSVPDIIRKVLKDSGVNLDYTMDVGSYSEREYVVQYQESDLNFITRLMEGCGIWYFFTERSVSERKAKKSVSTEKLLITDNAKNFNEISESATLAFRPRNGLVSGFENELKESVHHLESDHRLVPEEVTVQNYNYRTPETDISQSKRVSGGKAGKVYKFGGDFKDSDGAQKAATILAKRYKTQKTVFNGSGNCAALRAGVKFTLDEHARDGLNQEYCLTKVTHRGTHPQFQVLRGEQDYLNDFTCFPADQSDDFSAEKVAIAPKIPGIMTATIEAEDGDYAALDDKGRYKVRMPFDRSDTGNSKASKYMRLAQPYSGADYGIHFPSHEGTEMIVGYIDGNPDKPLGLGTIPNGNTLSPVKATNKTQSIIRTAGGNEMVFEDSDKKQKVTITTNAGFRMAFDDEHKKIELQTADENTLLIDDDHKKVVVNAGDNTITMSYDSSKKSIEIVTAGGHKFSMSDSDECVAITTKGGNKFKMDDDAKSIVMSDSKDKNKVTLDGNKGLKLESTGEISISASKDVKIEGENITVTGKKKITCEASSELKLSCGCAEAKLTQSGEAKISGSSASVEAMGTLKLKGAKVLQN